jgi:integrase
MGRYQYKREPLSTDDANQLSTACETHVERLVITGIRVSELAGLKRSQVDWQNTGESHFAVRATLCLSVRSLSRLVKKIAVRASIMRPTCPHVLPHILPHTFAVTAIQKGISTDPPTPSRP